MHDTEDNKVFQRFKKKIAPEPHQVKKATAENLSMNTIEVCVHLIAVLCSGATLQSRGPSLVGLFSAHPFRS